MQHLNFHMFQYPNQQDKERSTMSDSKRVEWIDVAKGVGIVLVSFGHLRNGDGESVWLPALDRYTCSTCPCSSYWGGGSRSVGGAGSRRSWRARPRRCWCRITCSPCTSSPNRSRYCSYHPCARPSRRATTTVLRTSSSTCSSWATDCGSSWRSSWANA